MTNELDGLHFSIRESGDGYELIDKEGKVVVWMLDKRRALRMFVALEQLQSNQTKGTK
jgi:hypothetical protein